MSSMNSLPSETPSTILSVVEHNATLMPDKAFLIMEGYAGGRLTFKALWDRATDQAVFFQRMGVGAGQTVALMLNDGPSLATAFVAAMRLGAIPFIMRTITHKRAEVALIVASEVTVDHLSVNLPGFNDLVVAVEAIPANEDAVAVELPPRYLLGPDTVAFLQHSSGTTGAKKGVVITHGMMLSFANSAAQALALHPSDVIASWLPLYHDMGLVGCLVLPMLIGATVVQIDPFDWVVEPGLLLELIERHKATVCWQPNFAFQHMLRSVSSSRSFNLSSMRLMIDCSEPCRPETLRRFRERFSRCGLRPTAIQVSYALAESVFTVTQTDENASPRVIEADMDAYVLGRIEPRLGTAPFTDFVSTGVPIPGCRVRIVDDGGGEMQDLMVGEIVVSSTFLFSGYFKSNLAEKSLTHGELHTGDYGFLEKGELFVCGRRDEMLIINGKNLFASDLEFSINQSCGIKAGRCVAIAPYDVRTGSRTLVIIAETEEMSLHAKEVLGHDVRKVILGEFGVAAHEVCLVEPGWLQKSTSGKVARGANEQKFNEWRSLAKSSFPATVGR